MPSSRFCKWFAIAGLLIMSLSSVSSVAEAQLIRRLIREGIQIRAPFVRVNVGPGGRMPPRYAVPHHHHHDHMIRQAQAFRPVRKTPQSADVDALPYPTTGELSAMEDAELVETMRQMMARLHYRLSLLKTGEGWQDYLVLSREVLGAPGSTPKPAQFDAVRKILPRYSSVQDDQQFAKISDLPSFAASFAALQEADRRFGSTIKNPESLPAIIPALRIPALGTPAPGNSPAIEESGPAITDPNNYVKPATLEETIEGSIEETPAENPLELQLVPEPAELPNADRGERSIMKRN